MPSDSRNIVSFGLALAAATALVALIQFLAWLTDSDLDLDGSTFLALLGGLMALLSAAASIAAAGFLLVVVERRMRRRPE